MTYGKLKTALRGIINRRDMTDALAGDFVNRAIDEIERVVRVGSMETLLIADEWDGTSAAISIPGDYLELSDIFTECGPLERVEKRTYFAADPCGPPRMYLRAGSNYLIRPAPAPGTVVYFQYYAETIALSDDNDENLWTRSGFNAVLYGAAALAADYFQMEDQYVQRFQGKSTDLVATMIAQDAEDRWTGIMHVPPPSDVGCY